MSFPSGGSAVRVLYGSETGNAEHVAHTLVALAKERGVDVTLSTLDDITPDALSKESCVLVICSTTGDGDMPWNADRFWDAMSADGAPRLDALRFAVLGLGDTGYFDFCQAAINWDTRFAELGAERLLELRKCDYEYEDDAALWTGEILDVVASATPSESLDATPATHGDWSRHRPYDATILRNRPLTEKGSLKEVRHLGLSVEGLTYQPGDSLGIVPSNAPQLVDAFLTHLQVSDDELRETLTTEYEISRPSRELVEEIGRRAEDTEIIALLTGSDRRALHEFLWARDILDLLRYATKPPLTAPELLGLLRPLAHRSYSISSSPLVAPDRIDLAVATLRYRAEGRDRGGVCSTHLADRLTEGDVAKVFLVPNDTFRPPTDDAVSMIMIGPGTGVAPFRSFLQERRARGAAGRNWLFFGGRHRRCDFLYGDELLDMHIDGLLTRLDLAFSRDTPEKIYVQHRMREQGKQLYEWLADGAHLYVCGDMVSMAGDVDIALHEIVAEHGGLSADEATAFVDDLRKSHRYVRDVY
ncbi:diflavin oxidoreductase [Pseudonocardia spinosispora]|uniref:diflavin oxidoreductase n=1 Tax=Pseudonocardia spinosispora TaxID=103441 RepID=UPI0004271D96|nr:sulfite reductase flavoprotein subunit alpha [Pseudonocardia spinosispora]